MSGNDPAFPILAETLANLPDSYCGGMNKREYFAAMAMAGLCAHHAMPFAQIAEYSACCADALIAQLNATNP